ncbi:hypothetical protein ACQ4PT_057758 [Festuca glaucescens]
MHFDGTFNTPGVGAGTVLTSPTGDKLFYTIQLCFKPEYKVSNNIAEYEGLLARLRAACALGIKYLIIKGDSQVIVNFSNKGYTPKDEHMAAHLEELRKMEKPFLGMELKHVPRGENQEADDIARRASHPLPQRSGTFEERLLKPSATPPIESNELLAEELPPPPTIGAPDCGLPSGDCTVLTLTRQDEVDWITDLKSYLMDGKLRREMKKQSAWLARQVATASRMATFTAVAPTGLRLIWGLDILGPFPQAQGGYRYLYVAIDKFTKWADVEPAHMIPARYAVNFIKGLVCRFRVPSRIITDNGSQFTRSLFRAYCTSIDTKICYASVAHPRSNG